MEYTEETLKEWVKKKENREKIIRNVCRDHEPTNPKIDLFMAGSPGAGKTETAKGLLEEMSGEKTDGKDSIQPFHLVHIDQDEIKAMLPEYSGNLSERYHHAASLGVEKVLDYVIKKGMNFILDSTFSNIEKARSNIERVLKKEYIVNVFFVYQEPESAWKFVKKREKEEGRKVPKESFVRQFINSRITVNEIKKQFDEKVKLSFVSKTVDKDSGVMKERYEFNVQNVDGYVGKIYTEKELYVLASE